MQKKGDLRIYITFAVLVAISSPPAPIIRFCIAKRNTFLLMWTSGLLRVTISS